MVTLWYRSPEILLGARHTAPRRTWWSIGYLGRDDQPQALFPGDSEIDQLFRIFRVLGTPDDGMWPSVSTLPDYKAQFPAVEGEAVGGDLSRVGRRRLDSCDRS